MELEQFSINYYHFVIDKATSITIELNQLFLLITSITMHFQAIVKFHLCHQISYNPLPFTDVTAYYTTVQRY